LDVVITAQGWQLNFKINKQLQIRNELEINSTGHTPNVARGCGISQWASANGHQPMGISQWASANGH
jgi:hypothetical protein